MCEFCMYKNNKHIIFGKEFEVKKCGHKTDLTSAGIMRNRDDEIPGIVIWKRI
nr:MAG TPA: hypothetical protein [Caudoviricetes sp.]